MAGVDDGVEVLEFVAVSLTLGPVHDVPEVAVVEVDGLSEFLGLQAGAGADESVGTCQGEHRLGLEFIVVAGHRAAVAGVKVVGPRHEDAVGNPLGGPRRMEDHVFTGVASGGEGPVHRIMTHLVDMAVRLIHHAFAFAG